MMPVRRRRVSAGEGQDAEAAFVHIAAAAYRPGKGLRTSRAYRQLCVIDNVTPQPAVVLAVAH